MPVPPWSTSGAFAFRRIWAKGRPGELLLTVEQYVNVARMTASKSTPVSRTNTAARLGKRSVGSAGFTAPQGSSPNSASTAAPAKMV